MPTYEYVCKSCANHTEVVQSFDAEPLSTCELCGGELKKVFGNIGIAFKGSGFYKNDSRSTPETKKSAAASTESKSSTEASSPSTSTESSSTKPPATKSTDQAAS